MNSPFSNNQPSPSTYLPPSLPVIHTSFNRKLFIRIEYRIFTNVKDNNWGKVFVTFPLKDQNC